LFFERFFDQKKSKGKRNEDLPIQHDGLPDSYRPSGLCPRCGKLSSFDILGSLPVTFGSGYFISRDGSRTPSLIDRVTSLLCRHCGQGVVVIEEEWIGDVPKSRSSNNSRGGLVTYRGFHWWPLPEMNLSQDIPSEIASTFSEASVALSANCPRASTVMLRRTLEAITVDRGETEGTLFQRLKRLNEKGVLHPSLADWAKEIRLVGNIGAHYDPEQDVSIEDAKELLGFTRELLRFLYELPAELLRRRNGK